MRLFCAIFRGLQWIPYLSLVGPYLIVTAAGCGNKDQRPNGSAPPAIVDNTPDPESGAAVYTQGCLTCHGQNGHGMPNQGPSLRTSAFVALHTDKELIAYIHRGRPKTDPANKSGNPMPPNGNIPGLPDDRAADLVAYIRKLQFEAKDEAATVPPSATEPVK